MRAFIVEQHFSPDPKSVYSREETHTFVYEHAEREGAFYEVYALFVRQVPFRLINAHVNEILDRYLAGNKFTAK